MLKQSIWINGYKLHSALVKRCVPKKIPLHPGDRNYTCFPQKEGKGEGERERGEGEEEEETFINVLYLHLIISPYYITLFITLLSAIV